MLQKRIQPALPLLFLSASLALPCAQAQGDEAASSRVALAKAQAKFALEGDPSQLEALARRGDEAAKARLNALQERLQGGGDDEVIRAVVRQWMANEGDIGARRELKWIGERAVPILTEEFRKNATNIALAGRIARQILSSGGPDAVKWLNGIYENEKGLLRSLVARSFSSRDLGSSKAMDEAILRFVSDDDVSLRRVLVQVLGAQMPAEAFASLLLDPDDEVKIAALRNLPSSFERSSIGVTTIASFGRELHQSWIRRAEVIMPALLELSSRELPKNVEARFSHALLSDPVLALIHEQSVKGAREVLLANLSRRRLQMAESYKQVHHRLSIREIRSAYELGRKNGVVNHELLRSYLWRAVHRADADGIRDFLDFAKDWRDLSEEERRETKSLGANLWKKLSASMTKEHAVALVGAIGSPLLPDMRTISESLSKVDWGQELSAAMRRRIDAGDFGKGTDKRDFALAIVFRTMDVEAAEWGVKQLERTGDAELYAWLAHYLPAERKYAAIYERLFSVSIDADTEARINNHTQLFQKALSMAPSDGFSFLEKALRLPMSQVDIKVPGKRKSVPTSPLALLTMVENGTWRHELAHDVVGRYVGLLLREAPLTDSQKAQYASVCSLAKFIARGGIKDGKTCIPRSVLADVRAVLPTGRFTGWHFERLVVCLAANALETEDPAATLALVGSESSSSNAQTAALGAVQDGPQPVDPEHARILMPLLVATGKHVALRARALLSVFGEDPAFVSFVDREIKSADFDRRANVLRFIAEAGGAQNLEVAKRCLSDASAKIRELAAEVFVKHLRPEVVPSLLTLLRDRDEDVRLTARNALDAMRYAQEQESHWQEWAKRRGKPSLGAALLEQAGEGQPEAVRIAAIRSIGSVGDLESLPFLIELMKSKSDAIAKAAGIAVETVQKIAVQRAQTAAREPSGVSGDKKKD